MENSWLLKLNSVDTFRNRPLRLVRRAVWLWRRDGTRVFLRNVIRDLRRVSILRFAEQSPGLSPAKPKPKMDGEVNWRDYVALSARIEEAKKTRVADIRPKRPPMVSFDDGELDTQASSLEFASVQSPNISIIIPVYNNERLTLECLASIARNTRGCSYEIIVIDDGSGERTQEILARVKNITHLRNQQNLGFLRTCNRAAERARGEFVVFLNNDAQVLEGWLVALVKTFSNYSNVGAVGPKVLFPDGRLQEAGVCLDPGATSRLVGLFDDPELPKYNRLREVDYVSGCCLILPTRLFREMGGFDQAFAPAYCEDVDLCFGLRSRGYRILYNPRAVVVHHLSATTSGMLEPSYKQALVVRGQQKLSEKWQAQIDELNRVRLIAFYLPQYHPIPENDLWWGKGFTEWTNVAKARPNFVGHYQPRLPSDFGFYDLRLAEVLEEQAELAKRYGIYGFCFYYYWFNGKRLLDLPLERIMNSNKPNIPFCLCWANENWTQKWDGGDGHVLMAQQHSDDDDRSVIRDLIRYMRHPHYIRIHGKPLLLVYRIELFPDPRRTTEIWREICRQEGLGEIYLAMVNSFQFSRQGVDPSKLGFDASVAFPPHRKLSPIKPPGKLLNPNYAGAVYDYREAVMKYLEQEKDGHVLFHAVMPSWDNTARRQNDPSTFVHVSPGAYQAWLQAVIARTREQNFGDEQLVFVVAWNEWAEGNYLEPDSHFGHGFLEATRDALQRDLLEP
ncbi:MAG: glycoside hydrolase family 99-like domain-containing protein [Deltaproteobacteria bacterium]|nr:glycoside hydrolase family 99-like domain-containing protein [Deltaproteobacteria bacterium]